jgi:hypothetical protein
MSVKFSWWPHTESKKIASFRLRCLQIVEKLQKEGIDAGLYRVGGKPDVLILSKRYDRASVAFALGLKAQYGTKLVLDICDNHFYSEFSTPKWMARAQMLRDAITAVDHVVCSTRALANLVQAEVENKASISIIGDAAEEPFIPNAFEKFVHLPAELALWNLRRKIRLSGVATGRRLVWFGNHGSANASGGMDDLLLIKDALTSHHANGNIFLTVISNSKTKYEAIFSDYGVTSAYLNWNCGTFSRALQLHDIVLIPVNKNSFSICKTNNRVATAFKHGLSVAATAIPAYTTFADSACLDDWFNGLGGLMSNKEQRSIKIAKGCVLLDKEYSLAVITGQWRKALELPHEKG